MLSGKVIDFREVQLRKMYPVEVSETGYLLKSKELPPRVCSEAGRTISRSELQPSKA